MERTATRNRGLAAAVIGGTVFLACSLLPAPPELSVTPFDRYGAAIVDGEIPYRDFSLEYPPGALPAIVVPTAVPGFSYAAGFQLVEVLVGIALVAGVATLLRRATTVRLMAGVGLVALLPLLLGRVVLFRFDLWPAALVIGALIALERRRGRLSAVLLAAAVVAKAYALALVPLLLFAVPRDTRGRAAAAGVVTALVLVGPFLALAPGGVAASAREQVGRGLQIESVGASALLALERLGVGDVHANFSSGSWNLEGSGTDAIATAFGALGLLGLCALWVTSRHGPHAVAGWALGVAIVLVCAKVLSPQFLVWLAPLVALVRGRPGLIAIGLTASACILTQLVYPTRYEELVALESGPVLLLVARNALLVALAILLVLAFRSERQRVPEQEGR